ncbi:hypothetical protein [Aerosakkonema funiforme]|uniref:hypothetical protein n=1 Tax=Aerosakkonema funiforme TaxID=1246630 RepID=UPI0035B6CF84
MSQILSGLIELQQKQAQTAQGVQLSQQLLGMATRAETVLRSMAEETATVYYQGDLKRLS